MAYTLRYYNEITTLQFGRLVRIEILERDYTGTSSQIKMDAIVNLGDSGQEIHDPIRKKTAELQILSTKSLEFEHLFTADDQKYKVDIYRAGNLIFSGFIESDTYSEPYYLYENYFVNFTARDRLGAIENTPYVPTGGDIFNVENILSLALVETGLSLTLIDNIGIYASGMTETLGPLVQSYLNQRKYLKENGEYESYRYVIDDILTAFGAQVRQIGTQWVVEEQAKFFNRPKVYVDSIYPDFKANEIVFPPHPARQTRWVNSDSILNLKPAWREFLINQDYITQENIYKINLISDDSFENEGDRFLYEANEFITETKGTVDRTQLFFHLNKDNKIQFCGADKEVSSGANYYGGGLLASQGANFSTKPLSVKNTTKSYSIKLEFTIINKTFDENYNLIDIFGGSQSAAAMVLVLDTGTSLYAMTDTGWQIFPDRDSIIVSEQEVLDIGVKRSKEFIFYGFPENGDLYILASAPSTTLVYKPGFKHSYFFTQIDNAILSRFDDDSTIFKSNELQASVNLNNNISENIDITMGEVESSKNSSIIYYGGLFDASGNTLIDWGRHGDSTPKHLLETIGIGYDLQNRHKKRQISGSLFWDWDFWTNIEDQGKTLMLNSGSWNLADDIMEGEWVEVFEYENEAGAFDDGFDDGFENSNSADYKTNTIFTLTEKFE